MKVKLGAYAIQIHPAQPEKNAARMLAAMEDAKKRGLQVVLFPAYCLSGKLVGSLLRQPDFLQDCVDYGQLIATATQGTDLTVVFGNMTLPPETDELEGSLPLDNYFDPENVIYVARDGNFLPGYDGHLDPLERLEPLRLTFAASPVPLACPGVPDIAEVRCSDIDTAVVETLGSAASRKFWQLRIGILPECDVADILLYPICEAFRSGFAAKRRRLFGMLAKRAGAPMLFCNATGVQNTGKNIHPFDGRCCVYAPSGEVLAETRPYEEGVAVLELDVLPGKRPVVLGAAAYPLMSLDAPAFPRPSAPAETGTLADTGKAATTTMVDEEASELYRAIRYATQQFLADCGIRKMVVGLSGGIDSAVTSALYADVLGPENLLLVNLPSRYNSDTTKSIAQTIAQRLGAHYATIPIQESVDHTQAQVDGTVIHSYATGADWQLQLTPFMLENVQARDRGARVLAALAAAFGGAFSCNGNKSEFTVGYATFYGDIAGAVAPLGDLWKHQVYALGRYLNDHVFRRKVLPEEIFHIRPSAELSDAQTVGTGGDPLVYEYHDYLFRSFIEPAEKAVPADLLAHYLAGDLDAFIGCAPGLTRQLFPAAAAFCADLERWYKLFAGFAVAKRIQAPPIVTVSRCAFGSDYTESQNAPYFSRRYYELKAQCVPTGTAATNSQGGSDRGH